MTIQLNEITIADNVSHGFQIEKEDCVEMTLFLNDGSNIIITFNKDAEITVITDEHETGSIEIRKTEKQLIKELQEENLLLKQCIYELSSEVYK